MKAASRPIGTVWSQVSYTSLHRGFSRDYHRPATDRPTTPISTRAARLYTTATTGFMRNRCSKNDFVRKMYRSIVRGKLDVAEKYAVAGGNLDFQLPNEEGAWTALHHGER